MKNVVEYLERTARLRGEKIACADMEAEYTFFMLLEKARQAGTCFARYAGSRSPIAIVTEKSVDALACFLGAAYAGCCYAAINPHLPPTRMRQVLDILRPAVVVPGGGKSIDFSCPSGKVIPLGEALSHNVNRDILAERLANGVDTDPLYVMFTSGSTGIPKGVAVAHGSVIDFIDSFISLFSITDRDVIGNQAPFDFDISVKDIYSCLATGARLEILPRRLFSFPSSLAGHIGQREVTTLVWAVSALRLAAAKDAFRLSGQAYRIDKVLFSGEAMPPKLLRYWQDLLPGATFVNLYGPTEITCNCTYHVVGKRYSDDEALPIGREYPNKRVFLLDDDAVPVTTPGRMGEICVSGSGLALGYYGAAEATDAAFRQHPLHSLWPERVYHTGDLGHYDSDGLLRYAGRKDFQVKHNGHRIEMGDIEFAAHSAPGVSAACCIYDQERIILFYEGDRDDEGVAAAIRKRLPSFMAPGRIVHMPSIPMTPNGKFDRAALKEKNRTGKGEVER